MKSTKEVVVTLGVLSEIRQTALTLRDAVDNLLIKVEGLMDSAAEPAVQPVVDSEEGVYYYDALDVDLLGLTKHYTVMSLGQPRVFATLEEAQAYGKVVKEAWTDESVLKLIELAKDYDSKYANDAMSEVAKMTRLYESHNEMPYSTASRLALAQYNRHTKWCLVKKSSYAYNNMQNLLKLTKMGVA